MASHGVQRGSGERPTTDLERTKESQKIKEYKALTESITTRVHHHQYDVETFELTSKLLKLNPEYYTIWNHRRLIMQSLFSKTEHLEDTELDYDSIIRHITNDLAFLAPLLRKFPKCYWIWNYRLWLLQEATNILPADSARALWQQELALVGKMLNIDSRNFHGWGYRRKVVESLQGFELSPEGHPSNMIEQEFEYTTKMVNTNLSNFSAWHNRSKLIPGLLGERKADHGARRKFFDEELELIQRALWAGSDDQSLWFYHQYLMFNLDPRYASVSIVQDLTFDERLLYVKQEIGRVQEMLDGAEDCKWIYQSLMSLGILHKGLTNNWPPQIDFGDSVDRLLTLDPLRHGRWLDVRKGL